MKKAILCTAVFLFLCTLIASAATFTAESYTVSESESIGYYLFTPSNATEKIPLIVYLHGGSGKGDDLQTLKENGFCMWVSEGRFDNVPAYMIFPQLSSAYKGWSNNKTNIRNLITSVVKEYSIDKENIALVGHSMGGTGAYSLAAAYPSLFSRVMPMSGSINNTADNVNALSQMPVWAIVGDQDTIVSPDSSIAIIEALRENGADAKITILEGATHFTVPELAFLDAELDVVGWLIGKADTPTLADALVTLRYVLSGGNDLTYDCNGDGGLSLLDVIALLKQIAQ